MNKPGYLDEVKSLISEFMQYDIREEELQDMLGKTGEDSLLHMKMQDVGVLYQPFFNILEGHYDDRRRRDGRFEKSHSFF